MACGWRALFVPAADKKGPQGPINACAFEWQPALQAVSTLYRETPATGTSAKKRKRQTPQSPPRAAKNNANAPRPLISGGRRECRIGGFRIDCAWGLFCPLTICLFFFLLLFFSCFSCFYYVADPNDSPARGPLCSAILVSCPVGGPSGAPVHLYKPTTTGATYRGKSAPGEIRSGRAHLPRSAISTHRRCSRDCQSGLFWPQGAPQWLSMKPLVCERRASERE